MNDHAGGRDAILEHRLRVLEQAIQVLLTNAIHGVSLTREAYDALYPTVGEAAAALALADRQAHRPQQGEAAAFAPQERP